MVRSILTIAIGSALYGFAAGSSHSLRLASWNVLKFPLLIFMTAGLCSLAYYALGKLFTRRLSFRHVMRLTMGAFADTSVLLASLSPVVLFLAQTIQQADSNGRHEYPLFLALNVAFIAVCGTVSVVRQVCRLLKVHRLAVARSVGIGLAWLSVSLFTGAQCAWFLRPFYGRSDIKLVRFMEGIHPDPDGACSFYEAIYHLGDPPPHRRDYSTHRP